MVGLVKHMKEIEVYPNGNVVRGVNQDLSAQYPEGREFTWHGFCSTTKSIEVLNDSMFCGSSGKRTIFQISLTQGQVCPKLSKLLSSPTPRSLTESPTLRLFIRRRATLLATR